MQTVLDEHDAQLAEDANTLAALNEDTYGYAHLTPQNRIEAVESEIRSDKVVLEYAWEQGYFNTTTGAETVSGNAIRTDFVASHDKQFINLEIAAGYRMFVFRYDASKVFISYSMIPGTTTDAVVEFDVAIGSGYYRLAMTKYDYALISVGAESNVVVSLFRSTFDQIQNRIAPVLFRDFGLGNRSNANQTDQSFV